MSDADNPSECRRLGDIVSPVDEKIAVKKDLSKPYVGLEHIPSRGSSLLGWAEAGSSVSVNSVFSVGDVLFGKLRPNLRKCVVAPFNGYCSTDILVLRANDGFSAEFSGRAFQAEKVAAAAERSAIGTKMPRTCWTHLRDFRVFCPDFREQGVISEVLGRLDTAIRETESIIEKLKSVKQGLLHDLLTRGIDANGELRPLESEAPDHYKKSLLGWIPKDWSVVGLVEVSLKDRSVIKTGPFGSALKGEHWRESGRPVVTIGSLGEGAFIESELLFVDEITARRLSDFELIPGDIVFSRVADVGRSVVVTSEECGWIMSSNFMRISVDGQKVDPRFLQLLLAFSVSVRRQIRATVNSGGRDVANSAILLGIRFPVPPREEQGRIIGSVQSLDEIIGQECAALEKHRATKIALMDDLLTGRVRVTPLLAQGTAPP